MSMVLNNTFTYQTKVIHIDNNLQMYKHIFVNASTEYIV